MSTASPLCAIVSLVFVGSPLLASDPGESTFNLVSSVISRVYNDCERKDYQLVDCVKVKAISFLDRISRNDYIKLAESITLVKNSSSRLDEGRALSENEIEGIMVGGSATNRSETLNQMMFDKLAKFLGSHSLKLELPTFDAASLARDLGEGRGKMKKTMNMFMMAFMMKLMMVIPMTIGVLFILAGKALIISKIALVLSLIILLKKLLAKPTEHVVHESHGWNPSAGNGGWDRRSYRPALEQYAQQAQNLAYNTYMNH